MSEQKVKSVGNFLQTRMWLQEVTVEGQKGRGTHQDSSEVSMWKIFTVAL